MTFKFHIFSFLTYYDPIQIKLKALFSLLLPALFLSSSCGNSENSENTQSAPIVSICENNVFDSPKAQADALIIAFQNLNDSSITNKQEWEKAFFCAFPNSFEGMEALFGPGQEAGTTAPLYQGGYEIIKFFSALESIPKDNYYEKYVNININGNWQGDNIRNGFGITGLFESDPENICRALAKKTDAEIESVFRFIYNNPHPENYKGFYQSVQDIIVNHDERLVNLNAAAFTKLLAEPHAH